MKNKWDVIGDSPLLFMEWPNIEIDDKKITLRSSVTKVTITTTNEDSRKIDDRVAYIACPLIDPRMKNVV